MHECIGIICVAINLLGKRRRGNEINAHRAGLFLYIEWPVVVRWYCHAIIDSSKIAPAESQKVIGIRFHFILIRDNIFIDEHTNQRYYIEGPINANYNLIIFTSIYFKNNEL